MMAELQCRQERVQLQYSNLQYVRKLKTKNEMPCCLPEGEPASNTN